MVRHDILFQVTLLLVDLHLNKGAAGAVNDKSRIGRHHQMAGFNDRLQVVVIELGFKGIVGILLQPQATDVIGYLARPAKQRQHLVKGVDPKAIKCAVEGVVNLRLRLGAEIVEVALNFHDIPEQAALNYLLHGQETGVEAAVLKRRDGDAVLLRQRQQRLRLVQRGGERLLDHDVFAVLDTGLCPGIVAVRVGADNHQADGVIRKDLVNVTGKSNSAVLRPGLNLRLSDNIVNRLHTIFIVADQDVGQMVAGSTFTKANKCAINHITSLF